MRTLLILTKQPSFASAIYSVLDPNNYQIITKEDPWEAESLVSRGAIDAIIVDADLTDVRAIRIISAIKSLAPTCPLFLYAGNKQWEWEEDAYMAGVSHVFSKPIRGKLLNTLLDRTLGTGKLEYSHHEHSSPHVEEIASKPKDHVRPLETLRHFSSILTHSLRSEALLKQVLLLLREIIGVNRAIIFLRKPPGLLSRGNGPEEQWLRSACAIGLEQNFLDHFALSLRAGIGGHLMRLGRILKASSSDAQNNREIAKEFQLLGAQVAIPILDRESLIGVAIFDDRLTGEPYANEELALIFHLLEEVGLAIRNSWLHDQLYSSHMMTTDILKQLGSGCVVVGDDMHILHANKAAERFFLSQASGKEKLEFPDLPQQLGSKVFTVMKTGIALPAFKYIPLNAPETTLLITISPFTTQASSTANAALILIDDITQLERTQKLEIETSNLRLTKSMAEHLAHEIGNSLVPIATHQQLLSTKVDDPEFRDSLSKAMADGVKRISRLSNQMMFLARDNTDFGDKVKISDLIVEALNDAHTYLFGKKTNDEIQKDPSGGPWVVKGDHKALRHAFSEVILNALQANPKDPNVAVRVEKAPDGSDQTLLSVEVRDTGKGFSSDAASRAVEPFFSTRNVGLGLGLTVTRKIIENHNGHIEISPSKEGEHGMVRISLPMENQS